MLAIGSQAPDFTALTSDTGHPFTLSDLKGRLIALYFYPKSFTPGCSVEGQRFEAALPKLKELGGEVVGVSHDNVDTQCRFAHALKLSFRLCSDPDRAVIERYGVSWPVLKLTKRVTFIIDRDFNIAGFHQHELMVARHVDDVLAAFKSMAPRG